MTILGHTRELLTLLYLHSTGLFYYISFRNWHRFIWELKCMFGWGNNMYSVVWSGFPANKPNLLCVRIHVCLYHELLHYREGSLKVCKQSLKNPHQKLSIKHSFLIYFVLNCQACNNLALNSTRKYAISSREAVNDLPLA